MSTSSVSFLILTHVTTSFALSFYPNSTTATLSCMALTKKHLNRLQVLQNKCARLILKQPSRTHASSLLQSLHWLPIKKRILFKLIVQAFKAFHFSFPGYLSSYFQSRVHKTKYSLRLDLAITFEVPRAKKQVGDRAFSVAGPHVWNGLPSSVLTVDHMDRFKNKLKSHLFS